jgi:hypothetical protein
MGVKFNNMDKKNITKFEEKKGDSTDTFQEKNCSNNPSYDDL